ncbi:hypothetical protein LEP1GSC038_4428 [Leptospira weilii str. 2006001855]|uniref:Uncharacterized protein n=1 Tax=Leptospira weilii str. 2006001855 TaxID=996804 RepID=M6FTS4_9LEPT|nr:hypothetical protein LEP1GSC051_1027 [Leptospira sp. P2653]EMM74622.1 hypothetical protein LEP1GSC038_4428 [Leptospira weilii str. 2006001855]OMI18392.1 hypothetical protein BUQ74_04570 [Leptospira weilii serovar Heyan]
MYNLIDCVLDELKRWDEAPVWFEKAYKLILPTRLSFESRRGALQTRRERRGDQSRELAKQSGSTTAILDEILEG